MCRVDGSESVEVLTADRRRARKSHRCNECSRSITKGEEYLYEVYVYQGDLDTHKTCSHCEVGRKWLEKNCSGFIYTEVLSEIRDHAEEYKAFPLYRIAIAGSRHWKTKKGPLMKIPLLPRELEV